MAEETSPQNRFPELSGSGPTRGRPLVAPLLGCLIWYNNTRFGLEDKMKVPGLSGESGVFQPPGRGRLDSPSTSKVKVAQ
ncbi:MAG: hypothetical protein GHCLOJNM_03505 [bacterium]|nr:hypothetical protein [bacterium]